MNWIRILFLGFTITASSSVLAQEAAASLHDIFNEEWETRLREMPLFATSVGRHDYDDKLPAMRKQDMERRTETWRKLLHRLEEIDAARLDKTDQINLDLLHFVLENRVSQFRFKAYTMPLNADSGFHSDFAQLPFEMPFFTVTDYHNYIARLNAFPLYMEQQIDLMKEGMTIGMTLPKVVLQGIDASIRPHIVDNPTKSVFYQPFDKIPKTLPETERRQLKKSGRQAILSGVVVGYQAFLDFMLNEYISAARTSIGASELPNGADYYAQRIRYFTTLDLSYEEIHKIGLEEVHRIRTEMDDIIRQVSFKGSFRDFLTFLRTDPRFYPKTAEELLMRAAYLAKKMDGKLPSLFKTLPRLPYGVAPVPDHIAPKYTAGRYVGPAFGSTEPGYYWVNTYDLPSRTLYTLEALTLHEAVPGHHLQNALARELRDVPNFRRFLYISAFGEGWGLYSERLGLEAGFYEDPYSNFGRLTYEMWRACRLVVDTGIHAMGWTRDQTLDFLGSNTALSLHEITTETDRYISWPGQALSYKIGELKIRQLRRLAEEKLGSRFDIREFHDVILQNGAVTLPMLEKQVRAYIARVAR